MNTKILSHIMNLRRFNFYLKVRHHRTTIVLQFQNKQHGMPREVTTLIIIIDQI